MYYKQDILRVNFPGTLAAEAELQMCFVDAGDLLALVHHERDDTMDKSSAEFMNAPKKAGFTGVDSGR